VARGSFLAGRAIPRECVNGRRPHGKRRAPSGQAAVEAAGPAVHDSVDAIGRGYEIAFMVRRKRRRAFHDDREATMKQGDAKAASTSSCALCGDILPVFDRQIKAEVA